tara:strand:- start:74 stop:586 length:513 start_codon:yes stop_codon:yes gene_type:complete
MKYFNKFLLILVILFISLNSSNSDDKIAFINVDYVIQNSNVGKKMLAEIAKIDKKNLDILKQKNKTLKDLELTIKNKKNVISDEAFNKEVISFKKKAEEFNKEKNKIVMEFNNLKKKEFEKIFKKISPIINDYMEENSVNILFDSKNIFMGAKTSNLSEKILNKINKEIK